MLTTVNLSCTEERSITATRSGLSDTDCAGSFGGMVMIWALATMGTAVAVASNDSVSRHTWCMAISGEQMSVDGYGGDTHGGRHYSHAARFRGCARPTRQRYSWAESLPMWAMATTSSAAAGENIRAGAASLLASRRRSRREATLCAGNSDARPPIRRHDCCPCAVCGIARPCNRSKRGHAQERHDAADGPHRNQRG